MAVKRVRKRSEGISHFKGLLRQRLCCLQASIGNKLVTPHQSPLLQKFELEGKDQNFLVISLIENPEKIEKENQITEDRKLILINQIKPEKGLDHIEVSAREWKTSATLYVTPDDNLSTERCHLILTHLSNRRYHFDLKDCERWGSCNSSISDNVTKDSVIWTTNWMQEYSISQNIIDQFINFIKSQQGAFSTVDELWLSSDGVCITAILEGSINLSEPYLVEQIANKAIHEGNYSLLINQKENGKGQIGLTIPIRLPISKTQTTYFLGFIIPEKTNPNLEER